MRQAAVSVVRRLQNMGHVAMFAGGCVRDMLMGKRPNDYDVATSARPKEVLSLFRRTQKVGAKFGVVLVRIGPFSIEVATFRSDIDYEDGRHPNRVQFTNDREDAQRRDFTINGMFYDPITRKTVDYVGGRADLQATLIRAIGDPQRRFTEDHLRILRAIRFAARLGFTIEPATWSAMSSQAPLIKRISPERIREELDLMLTHRNRARAFAELLSAGVLQHLWPEAEATQANGDKIAAVLKALPTDADFEIALAAVLHTLSPQEAESVCDATRCSNRTKTIVSWLIAHQDDLVRPAEITLADLKLLMAHPAFEHLLALFAAKLRAEDRPPTPYRQILAHVRAIPPEDIAPPPLLDGRALAKLGLPPGPLYKTILDKAYYAQLNGDIRDRAAALAYAGQLVSEIPRGEATPQ
jgi:tRNA nucleotidyltransferase/poly(A) polymerase